MPKQKITLTINDQLVERMKILAIRQKTSVSALTEKVWEQYLEEQKQRRDLDGPIPN